MSLPADKILVIGYGNPGRLDDGLGPLLAEAIAQKNLPGVKTDANYLLTVEDAAEISNFDIVIFADAALTGAEPFYFEAVQPKASFSFSSHHIEPAAVLGLAHD
ncbi:MAG: hydrogenase maturation protease, partial [Candidatus Omnitrophica bacterium]|nr:hydrogenase maturation protease [Candidatus Omnitrophota bacterium]